ncbi:311_t:CDS:1, partial [Cetraspora pellucida]
MKFNYLLLLSTVLSSGLVFSDQASALVVEKREPQRSSDTTYNYYRNGGNPGSKRDVQDLSDNEKREPRYSSSYYNYYRSGGNPGSKRDVQDQKDNEKREPQ